MNFLDSGTGTRELNCEANLLNAAVCAVSAGYDALAGAFAAKKGFLTGNHQVFRCFYGLWIR